MKITQALKTIVGDRYVLTGNDIGGYGHDWANGLSWEPICVARPANTFEVSEVVKAAFAADTPVVPIAGNTSVSGGGYAQDAVMISLDRLNSIVDIDPIARTAKVQSGVVVANLHAALETHELVFPLLFGAQGTAQIGGALSTNAGGSNVLRYGNVRALCLGIEVVLPGGRIMNLMNALHKDNTGYDLRNLMIGAEGTLGIITAAVLKLFPKPPAYVTAMIACESLENALKTLQKIQDANGQTVEAFEYMPDRYIARHMDRIHGAREPFDARYPVNVLCQVAASSMVDALENETGSTPLSDRIEGALGELLDHEVIADAVIAKSEAEANEMWARRDVAAELVLADKPYVPFDVSVPPNRIQEFLDRAGACVAKLDPGALPLWVAHLGDGNVHYTVKISDAGIYDAMTESVEDIIQDLGGSFSAEHGVGVFKRNSMARRKDPAAVDVMRAIKNALDPKDLMNPGKILPDV